VFSETSLQAHLRFIALELDSKSAGGHFLKAGTDSGTCLVLFPHMSADKFGLFKVWHLKSQHTATRSEECEIVSPFEQFKVQRKPNIPEL